MVVRGGTEGMACNGKNIRFDDICAPNGVLGSFGRVAGVAVATMREVLDAALDAARYV
jgi:hypothetical protein